MKYLFILFAFILNLLLISPVVTAVEDSNLEVTTENEVSTNSDINVSEEEPMQSSIDSTLT